MTALRTTIVSLSFVLMTAASALAGPPLATDDAGTVDVGAVELELNGSYTDDKETSFGVVTKCSRADAELKISSGLYKNLGVSLAIPYNINDRVKQDNQQVSNAEGFGDMALEVKYAFARLNGISFAIKPSVIMPTGKYSEGLSEGRWQFGTTLIATKEFAEGAYLLHANIGYERHNYKDDEVKNSNRSNLWSGSVAGEMEIAKGLFVVADFGLASTADKSTSQLSACAITGARYEISEHLDVNAGIKFGLTRPEDDFSALYGLVLKF